MDYWVASRLLKRLEAVMEQLLLASNFWDVIFKTIPEWSDMVRKCTLQWVTQNRSRSILHEKLWTKRSLFEIASAFILSVQYVTWCNWHTLKNTKYLLEICTAGWNWTACLQFKKNHTFSFVIFTNVLFVQNNYIFVWGNSWVKDLLVDPNTRPYGFPPALWIVLQKGATVVAAYECEDPLCRWMFMSCTPDHTLSIQQVPGANGTSDCVLET